MRPVIQLVRVEHGSHLYGTTTPSSDRDFKGVHLPSGEAILLQRAEDVIDDGVVSKIEGTLKNSADAIDSQSFSVQKFFDMLMKGDTVATEILFAPTIEQHPLWGVVQATGVALLNRECKGFVGYCVRQAAKYGIKGSRMSAVKSLLETLAPHAAQLTSDTKLGFIEPILRKWSEGREHVSWENIPSPNGTNLWHLNVCDRKMPMTAALIEAYKVYDRVWENYGERARAAMNNEGIDWKAMSHAVRVAGQAIELLDTGKITFPRKNAETLLEIKQGGKPYDVVSQYLEDLVEQVHAASARSSLPGKSDRAAANRLVVQLYRRQVTE